MSTNLTTTDTAATRTGWQAWMGWIRPWYIGAVQLGTGLIEGHIYADCERLLRIEPEPREGTGWLNPSQGPLCDLCKERREGGEEPKP